MLLNTSMFFQHNVDILHYSLCYWRTLTDADLHAALNVTLGNGLLTLRLNSDVFVCRFTALVGHIVARHHHSAARCDVHKQVRLFVHAAHLLDGLVQQDVHLGLCLCGAGTRQTLRIPRLILQDR